MGRSDEQIAALAKSNPDSPERRRDPLCRYPHAGPERKLSIYRTAQRLYPQEWRAANNTGMILFQQGDVDGAMAEFNKADQLNANNGIVKNNIGACYSRKGDRANAAAAYAAAGNAGPEVKRTWVSSISATVTTVLLYLTTRSIFLQRRACSFALGRQRRRYDDARGFARQRQCDRFLPQSHYRCP